MGKPAEYDFNFYDKDSEKIVFSLKDTEGNYINLLGLSFKLDVKINKYYAAEITKLSEVDEENRITFSFTSEEVEALTTNKKKEIYVYDIEMYDAEGERQTLLYGNLFVHKGVNL